MQKRFDIVVVGASFAGTAFVHNLPKNSKLRVLLLESKKRESSVVETTGLITETTRHIFCKFFKIDKYVTNPITDIGVFSTDFQENFFSHQKEPWIYQTDTRALLQALCQNLPSHTTFWDQTTYLGNSQKGDDDFFEVEILRNGKKIKVQTRFLIGADGANSRVAEKNNLSQTRDFFFGVEAVYFGEVLVSDRPQATAFHFWFGEFSLGYGGWLSSTNYAGKKTIRIGLAKHLKENKNAQKLLRKFTEKLVELNYIRIDGEIAKTLENYGSNIPASGVLHKIHNEQCLLIGDSAGFCGAFAADGIRGALFSAIEAGRLVPDFLAQKNPNILKKLKPNLQKKYGAISYYRKQKFYRRIWNMMRRNRTFDQMFRIIQSDKENFLQQFCDNHSKNKSLIWTVLKPKNLPNLLVYAFYLVRDLLHL